MSINVFFSQPMKGKSRLGIESERKLVKEWLQFSDIVGEESIVEIPLLPEWYAKGNPPVHCLGKSIQDLSAADLVLFSAGWDEANGCCIEHEVCVRYGIHYVELEDSSAGGYTIAKEGGGECSR